MKKWHTPTPWKAEIGPGTKRIIGMADNPIPVVIYEEGKTNTGFAPGDLEFVVECVNARPSAALTDEEKEAMVRVKRNLAKSLYIGKDDAAPLVALVDRLSTLPEAGRMEQALRSDLDTYRRWLHEAIEDMKRAATSEHGLDGSVVEKWAEIQNLDSPLPAPTPADRKEPKR